MELRVAKIVGTASETSWSQVHVFKPREEEPEGEQKLAQYGQLLAALEFKVKTEGAEVSSFGKEIIQRLQELYFSNTSESILKKVSQAMESLAAEFLPQVELKVVMAVIWQSGGKDYLYAGRHGGGQAYLKRKDTIVPLLTGNGDETEVVSGEISAADKLLLGTRQFFSIVSEEVIKTALNQEEVNDSLETLAAVVHGHEESSQAAGVVIKVEGVAQEVPQDQEASVEPEEVASEQEKPKSRSNPLKPLLNSLGSFGQSIIAKINQLTGRGEIHLKRGSTKQRRSAATVALILLLVFGASLVLAGKKRQQTKKETEIQSIVEEVEYRVNEAKNLLTLNPLRAKSLLSDSQARLNEYKEQSGGELPEKLNSLSQEVESLLEQAQREYQADAEEWFDFSLSLDGFKGSDWEIEENNLWVWDEVSQAVVEVNLNTKASKIISEADELQSGKLVSLAGSRGFVIGGGKAVVVDGEGKIVSEVSADSWQKIADAVGFSSNLYLLDSVSSGQIWKYTGVDAGLGTKQKYLKGTGLDLSEAVSMAIDGSVWVLFSDGTIVKYVRGDKDVFVVTGLDEAFAEPIKIYTSPEVDNIYVLDRQKTRVVVIDKSGEYQAQYGWSGIAGAKDLVVSEEEGKILLLTGEKVFGIDLKK